MWLICVYDSFQTLPGSCWISATSFSWTSIQSRISCPDPLLTNRFLSHFIRQIPCSHSAIGPNHTLYFCLDFPSQSVSDVFDSISPSGSDKQRKAFSYDIRQHICLHNVFSIFQVRSNTFFALVSSYHTLLLVLCSYHTMTSSYRSRPNGKVIFCWKTFQLCATHVLPLIVTTDRFRGCSLREQVISLNLITHLRVSLLDPSSYAHQRAALLLGSKSSYFLIWSTLNAQPTKTMVLRVFAVSDFLLHCQQFIFLLRQNIHDLARVIYKKKISDDSWSQTQARNRMSTAISQLLKYHPDMIQKVFICSPVLSPPLSWVIIHRFCQIPSDCVELVDLDDDGDSSIKAARQLVCS